MSINSTSTTLWCFVQGSSSLFNVNIGTNNYISELKEAIKSKKSNDTIGVDADKLRLWSVNVASINDISDGMLNDNKELKDERSIIARTFGNEESNIRVVIKIPVSEPPAKKRRIEQGWKSYTASDGHSVELPSQIIVMLESNDFVPKPRRNFETAFQNLNIGRPVILPNLGQEPKHFAKDYLGKKLFVTKQMIDIWDKLSVDSENSIKYILSGPMGVGKSYISYFLASKAYAEGWIILYIADASDLDVGTSTGAGEVICRYFLALNKDILTANNLKRIVRNADRDEVEVVVAQNILDFLKLSGNKTLLVVDEHGALFAKDPPVPVRLPVLGPLMNLNYWGEHFKLARVIFTGTAHAKYERAHVSDSIRQECVIYVGPIQRDVLDELLQLHSVLKEPNIKEEAKKVTNCVPREVMQLVKHIDSLKYTITNITCFRQALKKFENDRTDEIFLAAEAYYNVLQTHQRVRYYNSLTSMFLPNRPVEHFDWKFLDLGLIYRYKENEITHYLPLFPSARKALLKMYMTFDLPENIKNQLRIGELDGIQFEEALFNRLACKRTFPIQLNATNLNNDKKHVITLQFDDYGLIKSSKLSLGPGYDKVLGRGFDGYPRFDFMLGPMFIQVSISTFSVHNSKKSKDIKNAFHRPMPKLANISREEIKGRNQIEMYLDEMYGPVHHAEIINNEFVVTKNGVPVPGFRIVYIQGSPGTPHHSGKVNEFPDVSHVSFEEVKTQLFTSIA